MMPAINSCVARQRAAVEGCAREPGREKGARLRNDEDGVDGAQLAHVSVHARDDVGHSLADGDQHAQQLLRARTG